MQQTRESWLKDILFLSLVLGIIFFIGLGSRPLFVPDEGRYAEIAREMTASGNYLTPYLNGIKYFEKPILFYWLESAAIHLGGLNLWSIRSVNALLGLLGCLFTYGTARKLYDRKTGILASLILGTSMLYFVMLHMISLDLPVSFFLMATLYAFLLGIQTSPPGRYYLWAASIAAACAVLTKGLIGIVFPVLIIGVYLAVLNEWRLLLKLYLPSCLLIFFLIATPWHILVNHQHPEFFYFYFIKQHFLRYTMLNVGHYQPVWFFIPALIAGFFPWSVFLIQTFAASLKKIWHKRQENKSELFFILWASIIFIFFSLSKSKLIPYILPVFPPLAILTARYLDQAIVNKTLLGIKFGLGFLLIAAILITGGFIYFPYFTLLPDQKTAILLLSLAAIIFFIGVLITCFYHRQPIKLLITLIATTSIFLVISFSAMPAIDARSILPLANQLNSILTPQDEVVTYNQYYQDLPFYLQRRVTILNWQNELTYGMQHQETKEWMIDTPEFWKRWQSPKHVFVIMGKSEYKNFVIQHADKPYNLLGETVSNVLISNQKP